MGMRRKTPLELKAFYEGWLAACELVEKLGPEQEDTLHIAKAAAQLQLGMLKNQSPQGE
jgi:predicted DNA-binding ArsR family transcriptional regulator